MINGIGRVEELTPDVCIEVLVAANMLGLQRLVQLCEKALFPLISVDNVKNPWRHESHCIGRFNLFSCRTLPGKTIG